MRELHLPTKARVTSDLVPDIQLTHGRAVWVLQTMGFGAGVTILTFNHYIKSLRKLGVPFGHGEGGAGSGRPVLYSYNHLMELCLALTLRVYGTLPDPVLAGIIRYRQELRELYRRAYLEYATGLGAPVSVMAKGRAEFRMSGAYLDLRIRFGGGRAIEFGPPRVISPFEALRVYSRRDTPGRAHLPFNLSELTIALVDCAETAPTIRRGPH
jgi:hypothetical protein